jgi:sulfur carrier protein
LRVRLILNGDPHDCEDGMTVAALIGQLSLNGRRIAVEVNRQILARESFADRALADGDQVEIVQFVGGG